MMDRTHGTLLGGGVSYMQPRDGYRTGIEPVILAAAIPARPGERVLEAGCGAGAGLLCLLHRGRGLHAVGVELDPGIAALARENLAAHGCRATVATADVSASVGFGPFDHAFANPPWHDPDGTEPPGRRRALATHGAGLDRWIMSLAQAVSPSGTVTLALGAALAGRALARLDQEGFARTQLWRLVPKAGRTPKIVLLHAARGVGREQHDWRLHQDDGRYTDATERVLRGGGGLVEGLIALHEPK